MSRKGFGICRWWLKTRIAELILFLWYIPAYLRSKYCSQCCKSIVCKANWLYSYVICLTVQNLFDNCEWCRVFLLKEKTKERTFIYASGRQLILEQHHMILNHVPTIISRLCISDNPTWELRPDMHTRSISWCDHRTRELGINEKSFKR